MILRALAGTQSGDLPRSRFLEPEGRGSLDTTPHVLHRTHPPKMKKAQKKCRGAEQLVTFGSLEQFLISSPL